MINHVWSVVCGRSSTDRETNNLSLFDVIEQLNVLGPLPDAGAGAAIPVPFELVSLWSRAQAAEGEESTGRAKLIAPSGAEAFVQEFPINLTANQRMRTQLRSIGFPLLGVGRYTFTVEIRRADQVWETVARIPVQLESVAQPPAPAGDPQM
jgi:hypothetical protein